MIRISDKWREVLIAVLLVPCVPAVAAEGSNEKDKASLSRGLSDGPEELSGAVSSLGKRYIDPLNGFSLRPPAGTQRKRQVSPTGLVTWLRRDTRSGAIDLTLAVRRRTEAKRDIDLAAYAKALAKKLRENEQFRVESARLMTVAGRPAIDLRGLDRRVGLWRRQAWIWSQPGLFLIVDVSGPFAASKRLDDTCQAVLDTVRLTDPSAARKAREENLHRAESLLDGFRESKLANLFKQDPQWYLLRLKDTDVGYMWVAVSAGRRDGVAGCEVKSFARVEADTGGVRRARCVYFATLDRSMERWEEALRIGSSHKAVQTVEDGIKKDAMILCHFAGPGRGQERSVQKAIRLSTLVVYLPKAFGMVLPRLIDLKRPAAYAFATYTSRANAFDMRTFTVVGPREITVRSRRIEAVYATDQPAADAEPAKLYLDEKGKLLRMETAEGLVMETATRDAILRRFPKDEAAIRGLGK